MTYFNTWKAVYSFLALTAVFYLARIAKGIDELVGQVKAMRRGDVTTNMQ